MVSTETACRALRTNGAGRVSCHDGGVPVPSPSQLIAFLVDTEEDPARRAAMMSGWSMFQAARDADLVGDMEIDAFAGVVYELIEQDLLVFRNRSGGLVAAPARGVPWDGARLQEHHDYRTTDRGRADAELYRRRQRERADPEGAATERTPRTANTAEPTRAPLMRWFEQLDYVFQLPAGAEFPLLRHGFADADVERLRRYVQTARELADSSVLTDGGYGYRVQFEPDGVRNVEASMPKNEVVRGMAALFRQIYANEERASFSKVSGLLRRETEAHLDAQTENRRTQLDSWRSAQGQLRAHWLENMMIGRGKQRAVIPPLVGELHAESDGFAWPQRDGLKWPHLALVGCRG